MNNTIAEVQALQEVESLVPFIGGSLQDEMVDLVNARDLHSFLKVGKDFSNWIKGRIEEYGFLENHDFIVCSPKRASKKRGGHNVIEYHVSLDMAKELSMVERNEQGKMARQYFIARERQAIQMLKEQNKPLALPATLTPKQQRLVQQMVGRKVHGLPTDKQAAAWPYFYSHIKDRFMVGSYKDVPESQYGELVEYIHNAKFVDAEPPMPAITDDHLKAYMQERLGCTKAELKIDGKPLNYDTLHAFFNGNADPIRRHYDKLERLGIDVEGIKFMNCFKDALLTHYWTMLTEMRLWLSLNGGQKAVEVITY